MTDNISLLFALWLHEEHTLDQLAARFGYSKSWCATIIDCKINPAKLFELPQPPNFEEEP
jgi:hypothetical protein